MDQEPNHHGDHGGFHGIAGLLAALSMSVGRTGDARIAMDLAGVGPADRVVDVGSGPGVAARHAAKTAQSVVGVEPASVMRRVAKARTGRNSGATYLEGVAEHLPLPDGEATVLWSLATVHHWPELDAGIAEVHRVLEPGGRFVVLERQSEPGATGHASHGWTDQQAEDFAGRLRNAGFGEVSVEHRSTGRRDLVGVVAKRV